MRGQTDGLVNPHPLADQLPPVYQEDMFTVRFTEGLDAVLAPILATLDNLDAYVDPRLAPEDFLEWLAAWVGLTLDENWPIERRRAVVAKAVQLYQTRGTVTGLKAHVQIFSGGRVEIADSGGVAWSERPGGEYPGEDVPRLAVRITVDDPTKVSQRSLDILVASAKPAHVVHQIEVRGR